jgi:hypothetical protein
LDITDERHDRFVDNVKEAGIIAWEREERLKAGDMDKLYHSIDEMWRLLIGL